MYYVDVFEVRPRDEQDAVTGKVVDSIVQEGDDSDLQEH